jgi:hypothetical protein
VVDALTGGLKGETQVLTGVERDPMLVLYNKDIHTYETDHFACNAADLMSKYKGLQSTASKSA